MQFFFNFIFSLLFVLILIYLIIKLFRKIISTLRTPITQLDVIQQTQQPQEVMSEYRKRWVFMNNSEATFFHMFMKVLPPDFYIFPKTRVADIIETTDGNGYYHRRNKILSRHVDFLVCSPKLEPIMAIEIDGSSHNSPDRIERDHEMDGIFESVKIPLKHVQVGSDFDSACNDFVTFLKSTIPNQ